jgi:enoyl-CoA hydratase/carnithine racemase
MFEFFKIEKKAEIGIVTLERPPVNALSYDVYRELTDVVDKIEKSDEIRVVILTGSPNSRAWVGGADVKDLVGLDYDTRKQRYELINRSVPRLYNLDRPVIAAINAAAVGAGVSLASLCDIRIASSKAFFAKPEIDRGVVAAGGIQMLRLNMHAGKIREMIYTGRRFSAEEMKEAGFIDYVVEPDMLLPKAMEIATLIAQKSLPALKANKICNNAVEGLPWQEGYKMTQEYSARLTAGEDGKEGIRAFLERRPTKYKDR